MFSVQIKPSFGGKVDQSKAHALVTIKNDPKDGKQKNISFYIGTHKNIVYQNPKIREILGIYFRE